MTKSTSINSISFTRPTAAAHVLDKIKATRPRLRYELLAHHITAADSEFFAPNAAPSKSCPNTIPGRYSFRPYTAQTTGRVLIVAHVDTVQQARGAAAAPVFTQKRQVVAAPTLDDRLGVYAALGHLSALHGVDVLLTENEETGSTSISHFIADCQHPDPDMRPADLDSYRFAIQFDRGGSDMALYGSYSNEPWCEALAAHFPDTPQAMGIYTDITTLTDQTGIPSANLGCGYHNYHDHDAFADLRVLRRHIQQAVDFIKHHAIHADTDFGRVPTYYDEGYDNDNDNDSPYYDTNCPTCDFDLGWADHEWNFCPCCGKQIPLELSN